MATSQNPNLDPKVKKFIDEVAAQGGKPLYELPYEGARAVLAKAQSGPVKKPDVDTQDLELDVGPAGKVKVRITRPTDADMSIPVMFYIHGGGWVMGDENTHDRLLREITVGANVAVASIVYTPSPEAQYPVPLQQIYAAFDYLVKNGQKYHFTTSKIAVAGDSVGGNMTASLALICKEKGGPKIDLQILLYPVTSGAMDTQSYKDFADGPWLTAKAMVYFWDAYLPDKEKRKEIYASPLMATTDQLAGLPEAFIITDENDVLRDEGHAYAQKLMDAGVTVTSVQYNGTHHDFMMLDGVADTQPTRAAIEQVNCVLKKFYYGE